MKLKLALALLTTLSISNAFADECNRDCERTVSSGVASTAIISAPTITFYSPTVTTQEALKNDLVQVQDDAVIALETGVISSELKSVVQKVRADYHEDTKNASDIEVVEMVFGETK